MYRMVSRIRFITLQVWHFYNEVTGISLEACLSSVVNHSIFSIKCTKRWCSCGGKLLSFRATGCNYLVHECTEMRVCTIFYPITLLHQACIRTGKLLWSIWLMAPCSIPFSCISKARGRHELLRPGHASIKM